MESVGIKNIKYFPPYINISFKNIKKTKQIDCLFYGSIFPKLKDDYRNIMIDKINSNINSDINFTSCSNLYGDELIEKINDSKIILHIPSHDNLRNMPWAKIAYLMENKIFFIIEENDELYNKELNNVIIYYKRNDINDLISKIYYFKDNEIEKNIVVEKCYDFYINKINKDILLEDLIVI